MSSNPLLDYQQAQYNQMHNQSMQQIANQQNSLAGIGGALGAAPYWVSQPTTHGVADPGHSHGYPQQIPLPLERKESWTVEIEKTENGFLVDVFCRKEGRTLRYVATTVEEVMQNVATGMVTAKMEA